MRQHKKKNPRFQSGLICRHSLRRACLHYSSTARNVPYYQLPWIWICIGIGIWVSIGIKICICIGIGIWVSIGIRICICIGIGIRVGIGTWSCVSGTAKPPSAQLRGTAGQGTTTGKGRQWGHCMARGGVCVCVGGTHSREEGQVQCAPACSGSSGVSVWHRRGR